MGAYGGEKECARTKRGKRAAHGVSEVTTTSWVGHVIHLAFHFHFLSSSISDSHDKKAESSTKNSSKKTPQILFLLLRGRQQTVPKTNRCETFLSSHTSLFLAAGRRRMENVSGAFLSLERRLFKVI